MEIIEKLQNTRKKKRISRKEIADCLHISEGTYRDIEYGKIRLSLDNYLLICDFFGISPMELLNNSGEHYILLSEGDLVAIDKSIELLTKIKNKVCIPTTDSITIGDNNSITNSFNRK